MALLSFLLGAASARAQEWSLDLYAGGARFGDLPAGVATTNGAVGLRYAGPAHGWFQATAAVPLRSGDLWWGGAGGGRRLVVTRRGAVSLGVDAGAQAQLFRDADSAAVGWSGALQAMPVLELSRRSVHAELRSGVRHARTDFLGVTSSRTVYDSDVHVEGPTSGSALLGADLRHLRADEGAYSYLGGSAAYAGRGTSLWGTVGGWLDDALPGVAWGVGAQREVRRGVALWGSVQRDVGDPIYWNGQRTSFNVGATLRLGSDRDPSAPITAARVAGNRVTFTLSAADAREAPAVGGDFNGWAPVAMTRTGSGWSVTLTIPRGTYHYAFRSADGDWFVPDWIVATTDDGFGGRTAVLSVP